MTYLVSIPISEDKELATFGVKRKQMKLELIGSQQPMYQLKIKKKNVSLFA
jgi:hypothetical protein